MVNREGMNNTEPIAPVPAAARNSLAVVGFIALIIFGIALGIYSARFVPGVISRLGTAAVYLGNVFTPPSNPGISVVTPPTASTTIHFGTSTPPVATTTIATTPTPTKPKPVYTPTTPIVDTPPAPNYYGLPDLAVQIVERGYVTVNPESNPSFQNTFVPADSSPSNYYPAVKFKVKNIGTNVSGSWNISYSVPGAPENSEGFESMTPGQEVTFVIAANDLRSGVAEFSVTINDTID
jgi:hypothetical protein